MPAGTITDTEGPARVQTSEGKVKDAERGDIVQPGDRVITGHGAHVEVSDTEGGVTRITGKGEYEVPSHSSSHGRTGPDSGSGVVG